MKICLVDQSVIQLRIQISFEISILIEIPLTLRLQKKDHQNVSQHLFEFPFFPCQ